MLQFARGVEGVDVDDHITGTQHGSNGHHVLRLRLQLVTRNHQSLTRDSGLGLCFPCSQSGFALGTGQLLRTGLYKLGAHLVTHFGQRAHHCRVVFDDTCRDQGVR